jgi:hypothetical protein
MQETMYWFGVMKVKTISSTAMLVAGIDDKKSSGQLSGVIDAAIMIRNA